MLVHMSSSMFWVFQSTVEYAVAFFLDKKADVSQKQMLGTMTVWAFSQLVCSLIGLKLAKEFGYRLTITIAMGVFAFAHFLVAFTINPNFFMAAYGLLGGGAMGIAGLSSLHLLWSYFPSKVALVTGVVVASHLLSVGIFGFVAEVIINPDLKDDFAKSTDQVKKYAEYLKLMSAVFLLFTLLIGIGLPSPPSFMVQMNDQDRRSSEGSDVWEEQKKGEMLREFGTIVDGRAQILNQNVGEMKISGLDDLFTSPVKPLQRPIETRSMTSNFLGMGIKPSPLLITKAPLDIIEEKHAKSATVAHKSNSMVEIRTPERSMPLLASKQSHKKTKLQPHTMIGMFRSLLFWMLVCVSIVASFFGFYLLNIWPTFFGGKVLLTLADRSILWKVTMVASTVYVILASLIASKVNIKWLFSFTICLGAAAGLSINSVLDSAMYCHIYLGVVFATSASLWVMVPALCIDTFGAMAYKQAYSLLHCCLLLALSAATAVGLESASSDLVFGSAAASVLGLPVLLCLSCAN